MTVPGRIMGIDHGERRVGIALSDPLRLIARPYGIIVRKRGEEALDQVAELILAEGATKVVIGLPTDSQGGIGRQAVVVIQWARALAAKNGLPIVLWDESYSSEYAAELGQSQRKSRSSSQSEHYDDLAAAAILQEYLEAAAGRDDYEPGQPLETFSDIS